MPTCFFYAYEPVQTKFFLIKWAYPSRWSGEGFHPVWRRLFGETGPTPVHGFSILFEERRCSLLIFLGRASGSLLRFLIKLIFLMPLTCLNFEDLTGLGGHFEQYFLALNKLVRNHWMEKVPSHTPIPILKRHLSTPQFSTSPAFLTTQFPIWIGYLFVLN